MLSTYFIYSYVALGHKEQDHYMGYSFWLAARVLLYAPSRRQDSTHHCLCNTSHGALAGTRNSSMGPPRGIDPQPLAPQAVALPQKLNILNVL